VFGSTDGYDTTGTIQGTIALTVLDITDPLNPAILGNTLVTSNIKASPGDLFHGIAQALGNGLFAISDTKVGGSPVILLVDASNPTNLVASSITVPSFVSRMAVAGNQLYTTSANGLAIYNIGPLVSTPVTASVEVPNGTGVSVVSGSFNVAPTQVVHGTSFDNLVWQATLTWPTTFAWQSAVSALRSGEARSVTLGGSVAFTSGTTMGTLALAPTQVSSVSIVGLSPAGQTVVPGAAANYTLTLLNPTDAAVTYSLAVAGVPARWVNLPPTVTVGPQSSATVSLVLTSDAFSAAGDTGFLVTASAASGASGTAQGTLTLAGTAAPPDPEARGVVLALAPAAATAGQGTTAQYLVQVTNTGSTLDTFAMTAMDLPAGLTATFARNTIDVPSGAGNFRDVALTLNVAPGTNPGAVAFTVMATATAYPSVTATTAGMLSVEASGVQVTLDPSSAAPGSTFHATVTNTGAAADTFSLSLGGPAALAAQLQLGSTTVTLAPGGSQVVPISTGAVDFAAPGALALAVIAASATNPAV
jgi:uncharacterized membrane protein